MVMTTKKVHAKVQHKKPCHDCPMRRNSIPGWLGGSTPEEYARLAHSDAIVPCHTIHKMHCAGMAIYRTNVCKRAVFKLPADHEAVFSTPMEFVEWHSDLSNIRKLRSPE